MKETDFIDQNKDKWARFEKLKKDESANPDELSDLFVEITEDLSYARTFYPKRSVRVYLNNLAQSVFNSLYKLKKDPFGNFWRFWKIGLPVELYRARKQILAAFIVFIIAVLIGVVSTVDDLEFSRVILGDLYVDMTDDFIASGDPMAVYKQSNEFPMFISIFINNIRVAFLTFGLGILVCVGTGFILFSNGIMLGTFQTYFHMKGIATGTNLLLTSFLTIWIHGTFEILSIVMAGGAGFVAGMSILQPGSYTRIQSFQIGVKRGLKIMLGISPFIFIAAVFEGYVTRHTEMPFALSLFIILGSLVIFVSYFFIYPFIVYRKYEREFFAEPDPVYREPKKLIFHKIKASNEVIADSFTVFKNMYSSIGKVLWLLIIPIHLVLLYFIFEDNASFLEYADLYPDEIASYALHGELGDFTWFFPVTMLFTLTTSILLLHYKRFSQSNLSVKIKGIDYLKTFLFMLPFMAGIEVFGYFDHDISILFYFALIPMFLSVGISLVLKGEGIKGLYDSVSSYFGNFGNSYGLFLLSLLILSGFFVLLISSVYGIISTLIEWHGMTTITSISWWINYFEAALIIIFIHHYYFFLTICFGLNYHVQEEMKDSVSLFEKLKTFGTSSRTHEKYNHHD